MERFFLDLAGLLLIGAGLILLPTPIPFGAILIALGVLLLAIAEESVRSLIRSLREKHPRFDAALRKAKTLLPSTLVETLSKTEPEKER